MANGTADGIVVNGIGKLHSEWQRRMDDEWKRRAHGTGGVVNGGVLGESWRTGGGKGGVADGVEEEGGGEDRLAEKHRRKWRLELESGCLAGSGLHGKLRAMKERGKRSADLEEATTEAMAALILMAFTALAIMV